MANGLAGNKAAILRNHGLLTVGTTVDEAAWWYITMERTCHVQLMAEAAGMLTGLPGVCLSTLGPGSTNLVNAVANAWLDRVPMIAISGQIEGRREPTFTHQVIDHGTLFKPISKWATAVQPNTVANAWSSQIRVGVPRNR